MLSILSKCRSGDWKLASSNALDAKIAQTPNLTKMDQLQAMLAIARIKIRLSNELAARARQLAQLGFGADDAAHLASAEQGRIDIFLTTDDRLIRRARRYADILSVKVANPIQWLIKTIQMETENNDDTE